LERTVIDIVLQICIINTWVLYFLWFVVKITRKITVDGRYTADQSTTK